MSNVLLVAFMRLFSLMETTAISTQKTAVPMRAVMPERISVK